MAIPALLHQTWKTDVVPAEFRAFQARWRELHPHFEYRLWTDADNAKLVRDHYPAYYALYRGFDREIFRADMARCLYLHHHGGVYVDLDIEPLRAIEPLLAASSCVLGTEPTLHAHKLWNKDQLVSNAFMASTPGHPFWLRMLEEIERRARGDGHLNPVSTTGPITLDAVYEQHGRSLGVTLTQPDAFFPVPDLDNTKLDLTTPAQQHYRSMIALRSYPLASFGTHHWAHTWIASQGAKRLYLRSRERLRDLRAVVRSEKTIDEVTRRDRYGVHFPEQTFLPRKSRSQAYHDSVARGYQHARALTLSVLVLLHNRIDLALLQRARLSKLLEPFGRGRIFMLCEDSTDGTAEVMADWQRADPERVVLVKPPALGDCASVYARMARLRNTLLRSAEAASSDLSCIIDGDLAGPVSTDGVMHAVSLIERGDADAVAAFGINNWGGVPAQLPFLGYSYYDPIAFREHSFRREQRDAQVRLRLAKLRRGDDPLPVKSAFGGMVLYQSHVLHGLRYEEADDDCEHVGLHRALAARGARLVVDPAMLLLSGRQGHHQTDRRASSATTWTVSGTLGDAVR